MRNRLEPILRLACVLLAALIVLQFARAIIRGNPLSKVKIPAVPTLAASTNAPSGTTITNATNAVTAKVSMPMGTNATNLVIVKTTNTVAVSTHSEVGRTNSGTVTEATNGTASKVAQATNQLEAVPPPALTANSNGAAAVLVVASNAVVNGSNLVTRVGPEKSGTNSVTNAVARSGIAGVRPEMAMAIVGMPGMPGMAGRKLPDLAPATKARVDRIYESELLGQVIRPMPMALLGIAGNSAMLRSPSGQTGLVKEGDSLGELKLVKIGTNRVLVEQDGQKKELMIFNGYGGESLLSESKETHDETTKK